MNCFQQIFFYSLLIFKVFFISERGVIFHSNKKSEYQYNFHVETLHLKVKKLISKVNILEKEIRKDYEDDRPEYNWVWRFFYFAQISALMIANVGRSK